MIYLSLFNHLNMKDKQNGEPLQLGNILTSLSDADEKKRPRKDISKYPTRPIKLDDAEDLQKNDTQTIVFQHTAFCQTFLPYRNPGDDVKKWARENGKTRLLVRGGYVEDPDTKEDIYMGLPYGSKARIILSFINTTAIVSQSPKLVVADSMTKFITDDLNLKNSGYNINQVKNQLARLAASSFEMVIPKRDRRQQIIRCPSVVLSFDVWFPKDSDQRVIWDSELILNSQYFESLMEHAVPLDFEAIYRLKNNAQALDWYAWLSQRLHRIDHHKPDFISWKDLYDQFNQSDKVPMRRFKQIVRNDILPLVIGCYPEARHSIEEVLTTKTAKQQKGLLFHHAKPPVPYRIGKKSYGKLAKAIQQGGKFNGKSFKGN